MEVSQKDHFPPLVNATFRVIPCIGSGRSEFQLRHDQYGGGRESDVTYSLYKVGTAYD